MNGGIALARPAGLLRERVPFGLRESLRLPVAVSKLDTPW